MSKPPLIASVAPHNTIDITSIADGKLSIEQQIELHGMRNTETAFML